MQDDTELPMLVGIGASAGGLKALTCMIDGLDKEDNAAYVIAQHLSPNHQSILVSLLARHTQLNVVEACTGQAVQSGTIYVTPPNRDIEIKGNEIVLVPPLSRTTPKPSIGRLFTSLAKLSHRQIVGIILSGTGSDGSLGLLDMKSAGGVTLVQLPATAEYDGMPKAAIQAGGADLAVAPEEIGEVIRSYLTLDKRFTLRNEQDPASAELGALLEAIYTHCQIDLRSYKKSTLERRIKRRMSIAKVSTVSEYLDLLKKEKKELDELVKDIFINVTEFFRDPEVWVKISGQLRESLSKADREGCIFRVWVAGCSTGEEAYSIAILLDEINQALSRQVNYQIFATDISPDVIQLARHGTYEADAVNNVSPARRQMYFVQTNKRFKVNAAIRDRVVFSEHNIIQNVPFFNINLVICRNLLIYFNVTLQEQVLKTFSYALSDGGLLLLGKSESVQTATDLYASINEQHNFYRCIRRANNYSLSHYMPSSREVPPALGKVNGALRQQVSHDKLRFKLYAQVTKDSEVSALLVDPSGEVTFVIGDARQYLRDADGPTSINVLEAIQKKYSSSLHAYYYRAQRGEIIENARLIGFADEQKDNEAIHVSIKPFAAYSEEWKIFYFQKTSLSTPDSLQSDAEDDTQGTRLKDAELQLFNTLEGELAFTRESLQSALEELEIANEELQATNEELQSANEELQATNEELQTSNEELQSANEELRSFSDEMQSKNLETLEKKNLELEGLYNDLRNILQSISVPLIVVDKHLTVTRLSPELQTLFKRERLKPIKHGDNLSQIAFFNQRKRIRKIYGILKSRICKSFEVKIQQAFYHITVNPYGDEDGNISGAVITMLFITEEELRRTLNNEQRATEKLLSSVESAIIRVDANGLVEYMNSRACAYAGTRSDLAVGKSLDRVLAIYNSASQRELNLALRVQEVGGSYQYEEPLTLKMNSGREARVECSVSEVRLHDAGEPSFIINMYDVSEREAIMNSLQWENTHDALTRLYNREEILRRVKLAIQNAYQSGQASVFIYLDLDHFKVINDSLGHSIGDKVLQDVSTLMLRQLRGIDVLGRLGGDEFGLLLEDAQLEEAILVVKKLISAVAQFRYIFENKSYTLGLSAGLVMINDSGPDESSQVLSQSDQAMYQVKSSGGNSYRTYNPNQLNYGIPSLSRKINHALVNDEFILQYQPIFDTFTQQPVAWEELVRLRVSGENELFEPDKFMHLASRYGLLNRIDFWVLEQVYQLLSGWVTHSLNDALLTPQISVNLSGQTLSSSQFLDRILQLFDQRPRTYKSLRIEITEENAISNHAVAHAFLKRVRARGATVWLDDFGSGVNAFTSLKTLNIDGIKIDGSFVRDMDKSETDRLVVESMVRIAKSMDIRVVAEYVESDSLMPLLRELGVDELQGFRLGQPVNEDELTTQVLSTPVH